jgi:hypothetical protein
MARTVPVTSTTRLGTFLAVPGGRSAPVAAQSIATINPMARGARS